MKFTNEMIEKAKMVSSKEELLKMAKAENISLTLDDAEMYFSFLHNTRALSDDELSAIAGGKNDTEEHDSITIIHYD